MIYGIGIDIIDINRLRRAAEKWGGRFLDRVFTEGERSYCFSKASPYQSFSVRFAAKEAFIKAVRAAVPVAFNEVEVVSEDSGQPEIRLSGKTGAAFEMLVGDGRIHLSLSHDRDFGVACVVIELKDKDR